MALTLAHPSFSCCCSSSSSCLEKLWREIDTAESYLVSSQFAEAANLGQNVLQKLMSHPLSDPKGFDHEQVTDMLEFAGMVFIQAQHAIGRSNTILLELARIFHHVAVVPPPVFLASLCLQISVGCYLDAQMACEAYLDGWVYTSENEKSCVLSVAQTWDERLISLTPATYMKVLELYCIELLAKGLSQLDVAFQCVHELDIPVNRRQVILERLQMFAVDQEREDSQALGRQCKKSGGNTGSSPPSSSSVDHVWEPSENHEKEVMPCVTENINIQLSMRGFNFFVPMAGLLHSRVATFTDHFVYASRNKWSMFLSQQKRALGGVASFVIIFALYKQRVCLLRVLQVCSRLFREYCHVIYLGLVDFWQLAFNVHLSPLAAVQPLPSSNGMRR